MLFFVVSLIIFFILIPIILSFDKLTNWFSLEGLAGKNFFSQSNRKSKRRSSKKRVRTYR